MLGQLLYLLLPLALIYGAVSDLLTLTIPNRLILAMLAGFAVLAPLAGIDLATVLMHCAAGATVLAFAFAFFALGWIGGGDAKFISAIALWLGWSHTLPFILVAAVFGGLLAVMLLWFRGQMLPAFALRQDWLLRLHDTKTGIPYGIALGAAGLFIYPQTIWPSLLAG